MTDNLPAKPELVTNASGVLTPRNIDEAWRMATIGMKSGMLPDRFKSPEAVLIASQYAAELGLMPLTGMKSIAVVKGTPCLYGDLPLALCQGSGKLESIKEIFLDTNGNEINLANKNLMAEVGAAVCIVKRRGDSEKGEYYFTMEEAKKAGLAGSTPTWTKYPKRMLRYRARSQALKDKFADCLNGIGIAEYDHNMTEEEFDPRGPMQATSTAPEEQVSTGPKGLLDKLKQKKEEIVDAQMED